MKDRKIHVNKKTSFDFGKNEHHMLSGLGGRLITAVRQKSRQNFSNSGILKFDIFILKYSYESI